MTNSLYDNPDFLDYIKETKEFYLSANIQKIQQVYDALDFEEMSWFYARYTSYFDYVNWHNELDGIKYKILKSKKYKTPLEAVNQKIDASGLINNEQVICFWGTGIEENITDMPMTITIDGYHIHTKIKRDLREITTITSVSKNIILNENQRLYIGASGTYKGERSTIVFDEYKNGKKFKTTKSSNNEMFFNPYIHKINNEYFYEFEEDKLKRIYFIGKDGDEVSEYFK